MNWLIIALLGPILWSIVSHIDKYLLSKYLKKEGIGALMIFSSLFAIVVLPIIVFFQRDIFLIPTIDRLILMVIGILQAFSIYLYLHALEKDDVSTVVPFFQIIPVFGYFLGYFFLNEILTTQQVAACLIILIGALFLTIELNEANKIRIKHSVSLLMLAASFLIALSETLFKKMALSYTFLVSSFWEYLGLVLVGLFLFVFINRYRKEFFNLIRSNGVSIFGLNILSESLTIMGNLTFAFATLLAPITVVMVVNAYQPVFVFLGGILLTIYFPKIINENHSKRHLMKKSLSIAIILIGSYFL